MKGEIAKISNGVKIALGMSLQKGAFGGGNQFGNALREFLASKGIAVVFDLKDKDIDLILLTETRKWLKSCAFDAIDVAKYLLKKPDTLVAFRVNECDERKGQKIKLLNKLIVKSGELADRVVFISGWLEGLFTTKKKWLKNELPRPKGRGIPPPPEEGGKFFRRLSSPPQAAEDSWRRNKSLVIYNGADTNIFNAQGYQRWDGSSPLKIVTHHWGGGWFKGFDVYLKLDELIGREYRGRIEFTFIGNVLKNIELKNTTIISPKAGLDLAREIKQSHIYLTASINEPAGMHHIEGALCGLPILYRNSGALPEYCQDFGISFDGLADFKGKLEEMMVRYNYFVDKMQDYGNTSDKMCQNYYILFLNLLEQKKQIIRQRKMSRFNLLVYIVFVSILKEILWIKEKILQRLK